MLPRFIIPLAKGLLSSGSNVLFPKVRISVYETMTGFGRKYSSQLKNSLVVKKGEVASLSDILSSKLFVSPWTTSESSSLVSTCTRGCATLQKLHKTGPHKKFRPPRKPLGGAPMLKGVVLKTLIKKPKKPNSANRKCVLVRLSNGKEAVAYVPGIGHNLQEHNIVLVRCGRLQDVPGVKLKCIRGKYDLAHVQKPGK